ncbi:hypothetical protein DPEC_G00215700 [Dallia pectoralis]|uniref:Uncharacterized protein n=1 Tax=Dallia pectoralis TaxID=75939 RepID=A0ACC2G2G7_DALPE|nr:hypothetical protein DPEC_G00215700 [Dallia pectoralis]
MVSICYLNVLTWIAIRTPIFRKMMNGENRNGLSTGLKRLRDPLSDTEDNVTVSSIEVSDVQKRPRLEMSEYNSSARDVRAGQNSPSPLTPQTRPANRCPRNLFNPVAALKLKLEASEMPSFSTASRICQRASSSMVRQCQRLQWPPFQAWKQADLNLSGDEAAVDGDGSFTAVSVSSKVQGEEPLIQHTVEVAGSSVDMDVSLQEVSHVPKEQEEVMCTMATSRGRSQPEKPHGEEGPLKMEQDRAESSGENQGDSGSVLGEKQMDSGLEVDYKDPAEEVDGEDPAEEVDGEDPAEEVDGEDPAEEVDGEDPAEEVEDPGGEVGGEDPGEEVGGEDPGGEVGGPGGDPGGEVDGEDPGGEVDGEDPGGEVDGEDPGGEVDGEDPGGEVDGEDPGGEVDGEDPGGEVDGEDPGGEVDGEDPGGEVDGEDPGGEVDGEEWQSEARGLKKVTFILEPEMINDSALSELDSSSKRDSLSEAELNSPDETNTTEMIDLMFDEVLDAAAAAAAQRDVEEDGDEEEGADVHSSDVATAMDRPEKTHPEFDVERADEDLLTFPTSCILSPLSKSVEAVVTPMRLAATQQANPPLLGHEEQTSPPPDSVPLYSIDAYRTLVQSTKPAFHIVTPGVQRTVAEMSQPKPANTKERILVLNEEAAKLQVIINQTVHALSCCTDEDHGRGSLEEAEAEKLLLVSCEKREAMLSEVARLKESGSSEVVEGGDREQDSSPSQVPCRGTISISRVQLPLKVEFVCSARARTGRPTHYFFVLIRYGPCNIVATPLATAADAQNGDTISYPTTITLQEIRSNFEIDVEIYSLSQASGNTCSVDLRRSTKSRSTPMKLLSTRKRSNQSGTSSNMAALNVRRTSNFCLVGCHKITLASLGQNKFPLDKMKFEGKIRRLLGDEFQEKVPFLSPLEGNIYLQLDSESHSNVQHQGFLTMFEVVNGFGAWHRRFFVLEGDHLFYWNHPNDRGSKAAESSISLSSFSCHSVVPVTRDLCARPHTLELLSSAQMDQPEDQPKCWYSADTREDLGEWMEKLNQVLLDLHTWTCLSQTRAGEQPKTSSGKIRESSLGCVSECERGRPSVEWICGFSTPLLLFLPILSAVFWPAGSGAQCAGHSYRSAELRCQTETRMMVDRPEDAIAAGIPEVWPEAERAESLARGAALKWASGVFCRPEHLERLGQYRKRESQRTSSIHTRLKSMVQSYLEGVGWGLGQLREARVELKEVSHALAKAGVESSRNAEGVKTLEMIREVSVNHCQLLAAVSNLPRLYSVRSMVSETERLVEARRLLEAHARLMELERWQDDILWQLHGAGAPGTSLAAQDEELVRNYFSGVGRQVEALGKELWAVVGSGLTLARQNPIPFVSAVRIVEREEALDQAMLENRGGAGGDSRPLPPGRPRCWRERFFQVLEEAAAARFRSLSYLHSRGPGLAGHLSALQHGIMGDLATVRHLLEHCVPPHYHLTREYLRACHRCLQSHLGQVSGWELESSEIFALLNWVLHIYSSSEMMGHPDLMEVMETEELGPLISQEGLEQLQNKYVHGVRKSVSEWMHKALEVELTDWQRDQEPDTDHERFYLTSLPTIITQMLEENARVALMISEALRDQIIQMGLYELETLLNRFREALVEFGKEHRKQQSTNQDKFYLHYLLASISNCIILKTSTESLQRQLSSRSASQFSRTPPGPMAALDRAVRKACRLVMDQLLLELQPFLLGLMSRSWLAQEDLTVSPKLSGVLERHFDLYSRVRPPCRQRLQEECQWLMVVEYVRALMQKRLVCRKAEERHLLAQRMALDAQCLRDLVQGLEEVDGSVDERNPVALLPVLADFIQLKDPNMLTLELSGLVAKYPDISEEHVSVLLDVRGDVSRDVRGAVLDLLEQCAPPLPAVYRPIFSDIPVPTHSMPFCLPTAKCA